jgi:hypothetical protein
MVGGVAIPQAAWNKMSDSVPTTQQDALICLSACAILAAARAHMFSGSAQESFWTKMGDAA